MQQRTKSTVTIAMVVFCILAIVGCGRTYEEEELPRDFELPVGTEISVRPVSDLSPEEMKEGDEFAGVLAEPLYYMRERIDPDGDVYQEEVLIAPEGAPVTGEVVIAEDTPETSVEPDRLGLHLSEVTLHGGMSFDIKTNRVFEFDPEEGETQDITTAQQGDVLTFLLAEPADVAMVIDLRDREKEEGTQSGAGY